MNLLEFLAHLPDARPCGNQFKARCPAHQDDSPSLYVREGEDGRILIKCHAGCAAGAIVSAMGLRLSDLMPPEPTERPRRTPSRIDQIYSYHDEAGTLLFQNIRFHPKRFSQRRPGEHRRWIWNVEGVRRVPYRLPDLLRAVRGGGWLIFIVEGEKDADNLWRAGLPATTNAAGAGKWGPPETEALAALPGPVTYIILPDNDLPGARHAAEVRYHLRQDGLEARIVELPGLPPGGDLSDWLALGHTAADLLRLCQLQRATLQA